MSGFTPTLAEVFRVALEAQRDDTHTALPGRVTRYDADAQLADVLPLIKGVFLDEEGDRTAVEFPVVPNCPVQFAGGGDFTITFPIVVGDYGLLVFSEASLDKWLSGDGRSVDPGIDHRHHLTDGVFIPGIRPRGNRRSSTGSVIKIGRDALDGERAVLGQSLIDWLNKHTHSTAGTGSPSPPTIPAVASDFLSTDVKIT